MDQIGVKQCALIQMDAFYKPLTEEENKNVKAYNFDHPNALDFRLIEECMRRIISGKDVEIPLYDFKTNSRCGSRTVASAPVIILEGILAFYPEPVRKMMDLKIFINTDDDVRLGRRLVRDIAERGRSIESVLLQYNKHVKKAFDEFIKPTMKYADIIIPYGRENCVAIEFVVENIKTRLKKMGIQPDEKWALSPVISGKSGGSAHSFIGYGDATTRDIYEVANKSLFNVDPFLKNVWLGFLAKKLVRPMAKTEKLSKHSFEVVGVDQKVKTGTDIAILFKHAILTQETVDKINGFIEANKAGAKVLVLSFYSTPEIVKKVNTGPNVSIYVLICNPLLEGLKESVLNESKEFKSPIEEEYYQSLMEELSAFDSS